MSLAISNIAWEPTENDAVAALMCRYGVSGLEIAPTKAWANPIEADHKAIADYRKRWEDRGIRIIAMQALLFGKPELVLFGEPAIRERTIEYLEKIIELGGRLGAGALVFGSPKNRLVGNLPPVEVHEIAVTVFNRLGEIAQDHGTHFCIEPNPPAYGCDFVTTAKQAREIVQAVDHPGFRVHLDLGIMHMNGEDAAREIEATFRVLAHFHVSEPNLGAVGSASTDRQRTAARTLRRLKYDKWISIEMRSGSTTPNTIAIETALRAVSENFADGSTP